MLILLYCWVTAVCVIKVISCFWSFRFPVCHGSPTAKRGTCLAYDHQVLPLTQESKKQQIKLEFRANK